MDIRVAFDTSGDAPAGVDWHVLVDDIQAELDKLAAEVGQKSPLPDKKAPPPGAQGDAAVIHWLLHLATEPEMVKVYLRGLIMAVNAVLEAAKVREADNAEKEGDGKPNVPRRVTIKVIGKEIGLPVAQAAIKEFLENLHVQ